MKVLLEKKSSRVLFLLAGLLPALAEGQAPGTATPAPDTQGLSYIWGQLDYINLDVDQPNEDLLSDDFDNGGGFGISGSFPLNEAFYVYGGYSDTESDFTFRDNAGVLTPGDTDILHLQLGLGYIMPLTPQTHVLLGGGYEDIDFDDFRLGGTSSISLGDLDDDPSDGFHLEARVRTQLTPSLEGSVGARYTDIHVDGLSIVGNLMYEFTGNWGLNLTVNAGDELITVGTGIRYSF